MATRRSQLRSSAKQSRETSRSSKPSTNSNCGPWGPWSTVPAAEYHYRARYIPYEAIASIPRTAGNSIVPYGSKYIHYEFASYDGATEQCSATYMSGTDNPVTEVPVTEPSRTKHHSQDYSLGLDKKTRKKIKAENKKKVHYRSKVDAWMEDSGYSQY
ncbi:hypothetical protein BGZ63DRAFT_237887 [Mariannaea sp. PMI_226]|nr:hypothetical protein BGZ63DRAFT_237887 [Mariannaea sp. PMI_226]